MNHRILTCIALLLLSSAFATSARPRKKPVAKKQPQVESYYKEIDNYDFLYENNGENRFFSATRTLADDIISQAMNYLGRPYRSGSKGPSSFDCSGFTSYVFGLNNFSIGCSSRDQYARNIPIKRNEMQRGDLVFFTSPGSGRAVGHVGIIVDVDPVTQTFSFIHASSSAGVKVSKSTDSGYANRYVGVRRVF